MENRYLKNIFKNVKCVLLPAFQRIFLHGCLGLKNTPTEPRKLGKTSFQNGCPK